MMMTKSDIMAPIQKFHPLHLYFYRYCTKWRFLHLSPANLHMFVRIYLAFIFFDPQEKNHKYFVKTPTQNQEMLVVNGIARYLGNICVHPPSLHPNYNIDLQVILFPNPAMMLNSLITTTRFAVMIIEDTDTTKDLVGHYHCSKNSSSRCIMYDCKWETLD